MKSKVFNHVVGTCLLLLISITLQAAAGPKREFSKTINREFATSADGMTALYNRYGKVNVNTWNENKVKIDITIIVNASDQAAADKSFDKIKVNFANSYGYVKAETMIEEMSGICNDFKINYEVWMPVGNQLDLKNKYGNSYVSNLNGKLTAEIKYGDLRTQTVNNDVDLVLEYGKAGFDKTRNVLGQIGYGGLTIADAGNLQLDTKYSELNIQKAGALRITSKYDEFRFGQIDELRLQTKYTDVHVDNARTVSITAQYADLELMNVQEFIDADLLYGDMNVGQLGRNFREANIIGKYTDIEVGVERGGGGFRFDIDGSYTDFEFPQGVRFTGKSEEGTRKTALGYLGDNNAKGLVKARLIYGNLLLK